MPTRTLADLAKAFFENVTGYNATTDTFSPSTQADVAGVSTLINAGNANQASGTPTAGSFAQISGNGKATAAVSVTANTLNVALLPQGSLDGNNWVNLGPVAFLNQNTGVYSSSIPAGSNGVYTAAIADFPFFRVSTPSGAPTGSATVVLNASATQAILAVEPPKYNTQRATADLLAKTGPGMLHSISVSASTAAPTAGLLTIYDNTAESGTVLYSEWVTASVAGHTIVLDVGFAIGCFIGFDATLANVAVTAALI